MLSSDTGIACPAESPCSISPWGRARPSGSCGHLRAPDTDRRGIELGHLLPQALALLALGDARPGGDRLRAHHGLALRIRLEVQVPERGGRHAALRGDHD